MNSENVYEQKFKILSFLIDNKSQLTPHDLLSYLQEVAWAHVNEYHVGWDYLQQFDMFWAVIRSHIIIERMPEWNEEVTLRTWGKPYSMLIHPRDYEMVDENQNIILRSTSSWVILDKNTGKPQKMDNYSFKYFMNEYKNAIIENAPKIRQIEINGTPVFKPVVYSDLDINQHVNNARYFQWAMDEFSAEFHQTHDLKEIFINYISQAKAGDRYSAAYKEIVPGTFITLLYSEKGKQEFCRIQTVWKKRA